MLSANSYGAASGITGFTLLTIAAGIGTEHFLALGNGKPQRAQRMVQMVVGLLVVTTVVPHAVTGMNRYRAKHTVNTRIGTLTNMVKSRLPASRRLWGDSSVVPTIAFRADIRIPANDFNTNDARIRTGMTTPIELLTRAHSEGPAAVLLVRRHGIAIIPQVRHFTRATMKLDWVFHGGLNYRPLYFLPTKDWRSYPRLTRSKRFRSPHRRRARRSRKRRAANRTTTQSDEVSPTMAHEATATAESP